jgi:NAD(P)-dependent dehydrogenase (short-subunit alcohol dehydrogenase family)
MTSRNRVLVLGGTGSIGRLVVPRPLELTDQVRVVCRNGDPARRSLPLGTEVVDGDVTDAASVAAALDAVDAVVLTHGAPYGSGDYEAVDYGATATLLDALEGQQVRVALMSSIGVTGTEQHVDLRQGDLTEHGRVRRSTSPRLSPRQSAHRQAVGRTLEVFSADGPTVTGWDTAFGATDADQSGALDGARDRPGPGLEQEPERVRGDLRRYRATP